MAHDDTAERYRRSFWAHVARTVSEEPGPNQCRYVHANGVSRCGQAISQVHGGGEWCYSHSRLLADGMRGTPMTEERRRRQMETEEERRERNRQIMIGVRKKQDERVLTHLTDAAHAISPCPDNGSVAHGYTELASGFRHRHGRWPLWWEMAKLIWDEEHGKDAQT